MTFQIQKDVSLAELTTLKIGGRARFFASVANETEIIEAFNFANENNLEIFILGGGSNVLIADQGFNGLVLRIALKGISTFTERDGLVRVKAGAGEDWDLFCKFCVEKNLQGIECLSGIPGFVGGTPVQNVGAYGQEVAETIVMVRCFDRQRAEFVELSNAECGFAYRTSVFNTTEKNRYIVSTVIYALKFSGETKILYRDLQKIFGDAKPNLEETREAVLKIRREKSMVIVANDPNSQSAGSFFKNPIIDKKRFAKIENRVKTFGIENIPFFEIDEETVKIPAAWLIENSGFHKGYELGQAGISTKHTLAIINRGDASAKDILDLKEHIQASVKEKFDIELKPEPVFIGFESNDYLTITKD